MNKKIYISAVCALAISASAADLGTISVKEKVNTQVVDKINTTEVKNADLAESLTNQSASISMIRRSGISNDIILRGQKRDNIVVTIDDLKVFGACANRMDPPISHAVNENVDKVIVTEGPYDVTEFGTLSGSVKVKTKKISKKLKGNIETTVGSFGYKKGSIGVSGGNDTIRVGFTASTETSDQYEDGDGNTLAQQVEKKSPTKKYNDAHKDMDAYTKKSYMGKAQITIDDKQNLDLSYTVIDSDDIIYPSTGMDALEDKSHMLNLKYMIKELSSFSKKLEIRAYHSDVSHPMSNRYRVGKTSLNDTTNDMTTDAKGLKILNTLDIFNSELLIGVDHSIRNWDGDFYIAGNYASGGPIKIKSIADSDTKNSAIFLQDKKAFGKVVIKTGLRYDKTTIDNTKTTQNDLDRDFHSTSANIFTTYNQSKNLKYFAGIGQAYRVPDSRELYFKKWMMGLKDIGTDTLDQTKNSEIDLGMEKKCDEGKLKAKVFYSKLKNYIYFHKGIPNDNFENIDAKIYGLELSAARYLNDQFTLDMAYSYKKGKKDNALNGQTDTDLADITPAKAMIGLTYDYNDNIMGKISVINVASWKDYDSDNGEQAIDGYTTVNFKSAIKFNKRFETTFGVDNIFDKTYQVSNTYADLALNLDTSGEVMLLNEPGRYVYANLKFKF